MKTIISILLLFSCLSAQAASYFLSATGSDGNNGLSTGAPWLSPNHALNCGDTITAAASTSYSAANFASGQWGAVTCPAGNNVAWLQCATFDACKISVTSGTGDGMHVSASYWGVQGWEIANTSSNTSGGGCFNSGPPSTTSIHHVIFANDIANVCPGSGFGGGVNGSSASMDYVVMVGNIVYGAAAVNTFCNSGLDIYEPIATDSNPGTHIFVSGNFVIGTSNPSGCFDGNGIIFDTFDGNQTGLPASYSQQAVIDNNLVLSNGGKGILVEYNNTGAGPSHSPIYIRGNTAWKSNIGAYQAGVSPCGEIFIYKTVSTIAWQSIGATGATGCYTISGNPSFALGVENVDSSSGMYENVAWSATGTYIQSTTATGFVFGPGNITGSPSFTSAAAPSAPGCGSNTSVPNCMAAVIANFVPTSSPLISYGYQTPSTTSRYDPLYPQWLCSVNLPSGLVTPGCSNGGSLAGSGTAAKGALIR